MAPRADGLAGALPTFTAIGRRVRDRVAGFFPVRIQGVAFSGAQSTRLTSDWVHAPLTSADQEVRSDVRTLRRRSREVCRNVSYASRYLGLLAENVVGPHGIRLQARVEGVDGRQDSAMNREIEAAWRRWSRPENASVTRRHSWVDIQNLAVQTRAQDGECLIRIVEGFDNPFSFALQFIDADQLDVTFDRARGPGQNEVRMGVEVDEWGGPVAYHCYRSHPHDYITERKNERERIPAREIIHLFRPARPGQTRGVPDLAPVLMDIRMLAALQEAEIVASRISAAKAGFFVADDETVPDPNTPRGRRKRAAMRVEPGLFDFLPDGAKDFKPWAPEHPNSAFGEFNKVILRSIATGLRSSYSSLSGDLTSVSYSSIRDGTIKERDVYRSLQWSLVAHLHERVFERWLAWAITTRQIRLGKYSPRDIGAHEWLPRGFEWVDPLKEILALKESCDLFVDSRTRAAGERGRDFEEVVADRAREEEIIREAGLADTEPSERRFTLRDDDAAASTVDDFVSARLRDALRAPETRNGHGSHAGS